MDAAEKTRENRARRLARRQGLELQRHRARDPRHLLYGTYQITKADGAVLAAKEDPAFGYFYGLTLGEAESALNDPAEMERFRDAQLAVYRRKMAAIREPKEGGR